MGAVRRVAAMESPSSPGDQSLPPFLTVKEAAAYLRLNVKTVYAMIAGNTLRAVRCRRTIRIPRDALLDPGNGTPQLEPQRKGRGRRRT
jgi:excisionase family DNA binding protein